MIHGAERLDADLRERRAGEWLEHAVELDRHLLAVDVDPLLAHDDVVAGQADEPLDVVGRGVGRQAEHDDVAALRLAERDDLAC